VRGVKGDHLPAAPAAAKEALQTMVSEDAHDEILAQASVVQAPLLLHRQHGEGPQQLEGEQAAPLLHRHAGVVGDLDALHAAAG
jgi:hypothetical protein